MKNRLLSFFLVVLFALSMIGTAFAEENEKILSNSEERTDSSVISEGEYMEYRGDTIVNPLYPEYSPEEAPVVPKAKKATKAATTTAAEYSTVETAGTVLRSEMVDRNGSITIRYNAAQELSGVNSSQVTAVINQLQMDILEESMKHTGNGKEGDSLRWQYASITPSWSGNTSTKIFNLKYENVYYTTQAQEELLDKEIARIEPAFGFDSNTSDYEKTLDIYDYICSHVTYDYDNLMNKSYTLKYTPYAALLNKTSVCQGYALLFYRLALDSGVDARLIPGTASGNHAWNIVELNGKYYYLDSTWDAENNTSHQSYEWFLKGSDHFPDHTAGVYENGTAAYLPEELNQLSKSDYTIPLSIRKEPINVYAQPDDYILFTVDALGSNLTYEWDFWLEETGEWYNLGADTSWLYMQANSAFDGLQFRCQVSDGTTTETTKAATLHLTTYTYGITEQPEHTAVYAGETAKFHVSAVGDNLSYQWQTLNTNNRWVNVSGTSARTNTLSVTATKSDNRKRFRCVVTDGSGNVDISNQAILGIVRVENPVATLKSHTLSLTGNIGIIYNLYLSDEAINDKEAKIMFTRSGKSQGEMLLSEGTRKTDKNGVDYYGYCCEVHSSQMTAPVMAKVVLSDGSTSEEFPYTVKDYADIIIANRNNSAAFTQVTPLVKAMLNYGGYAQEYFQYEKTLPLANADLTNSEKDVSGVKAADLAKYASVKKGTAPVGLNYKSGQLVLTSETTILFNFNLADGHKISEYTFKNGNKVLTPKLRSGNVYYVEIPNVASSELDTMYTVTVGNFSVSYAALTYAYNQLKKDTTEESLQNLLRSLVLYNKEANNYFNK